jgi:hypothetical protein
MSTEPVVKMSPLCRSLTVEGHTVQVEIYNERFDTDQQALDEVSQTIRFLGGMTRLSRGLLSRPARQPLRADEINRCSHD